VEGTHAPLRLDAAGLPPVPESDVVPASQLEARLALAQTHGGEGAWRVSLHAASGVMGRHYRLDVRWLRYEAVVLTAATGPGGAGVPVGDLAWVGAAVLVGLAGCSLAVAAFARRGRTKPDLALPEGDNRSSWER
jgi:hypothetical protein